MQESNVLVALGLMLVLAWIVNWVGRRAFVPSIVSYLATGLLMVPLWTRLEPLLVERTVASEVGIFEGLIHLVGEVGIVLLLFIVGLELSLDKIRGVGKVAVYAGLGQVLFTAVGGYGISIFLGFSRMEALFLGVALTFSSTVVVVKLLDQKRELDTLYGRIAVGIFLVQDLVVIVALTLLSGLSSIETFNAREAAWSLGKAFLGAGVLLVISAVSSRRLLQRPFSWAAGSPETLLVWSLGWCFAYVVVAELLGLSPELGSFLAGVSLAQLDCSRDLRRRIHPLMNFFVAVFFIALGAQLPLESAAAYPVATLALSLFVLIGNPLIFIWIIARLGYSRKTSFLTAVTVAQISEFSFVFAAKGVSAGLIDESILGVTAVVGIATIAGSSYMILYNDRLYTWAERFRLLNFFADRGRERELVPFTLRQHWVVVGANALGRTLVRLLLDRNQTVAWVDRDPAKLRAVPAIRVHGSIEYLSVLEEAGLERAHFAVSALRIQDVNNLLAFRCRQLRVPVAIHAFDRSAFEALRELRVDYVINSKRAGVDEFIRLLESDREDRS